MSFGVDNIVTAFDAFGDLFVLGILRDKAKLLYGNYMLSFIGFP